MAMCGLSSCVCGVCVCGCATVFETTPWYHGIWARYGTPYWSTYVRWYKHHMGCCVQRSWYLCYSCPFIVAFMNAPVIERGSHAGSENLFRGVWFPADLVANNCSCVSSVIQFKNLCNVYAQESISNSKRSMLKIRRSNCRYGMMHVMHLPTMGAIVCTICLGTQLDRNALRPSLHSTTGALTE